MGMNALITAHFEGRAVNETDCISERKRLFSKYQVYSDYLPIFAQLFEVLQNVVIYYGSAVSKSLPITKEYRI